MIRGSKILAVIPARGGSKGMIKKNLRKIDNVPLVTLAAQVASQSLYVDDLVVSTDCEEIGIAAKNGGAKFDFTRPEHLSGDQVADLPVLKHSLETSEKLYKARYDIIVMLQPTSPLRKRHHVDLAIEQLVNDNLNAVWTVTPTDSKNHPLKQLTIENGHLDYFDPAGKQIIARQQLTQLYQRNGVAYVVTRELLSKNETWLTNNCGALIIEEPMVSIDTELDLKFAEFLLRK